MRVKIKARTIGTVVNADVAHVGTDSSAVATRNQATLAAEPGQSSEVLGGLVYLVHNHADRKQVLAVKADLEARGVRTWMDQAEITPGTWYQDEFQKALRAASAAVVFFGPHGVGRWQAAEIRVLLEEQVQRGTALVPVLLPEVNEVPEAFIVIRQLECVRFHGDADEAAVGALVDALRSCC
jgi:hypothetical protein